MAVWRISSLALARSRRVIGLDAHHFGSAMSGDDDPLAIKRLPR